MAPTVRAKPLKINAGNSADGTDAKSPAPIWLGKNRGSGLEYAVMSAAEALKAARAAGIEIALDGDDLALSAASAPPAPVLDALLRHKAEIMVLLRPAEDGWTAEDWQVFFDERAGIAEYESGLPRSEAESSAFETCVTEWLNRNPYGSDRAGHAWLHAITRTFLFCI